MAMARSAREIINEHVWGGQAKLVAYRKQYEGSGKYVPPSTYDERDAQLMQSLLTAQALLENAAYGPEDEGFKAALVRWVVGEWGGYLDRESYTVVERLRKPAPLEVLGEHDKL
jgi:hypothetical protein